MKIAVIGTGNVGGALARAWAHRGHEIRLGVQDLNDFKGKDLLQQSGIAAYTVAQAVAPAEVVLIAIPPTAVFDVLEQMGDVRGKTLIDATNTVRQAPEPYPTVYHCLRDRTKAAVVKCFNTTGFENMLDPRYGEQAIDMFLAGDDEGAKDVARSLALDCGFGACWDFGKGDKVELLEKFALSWINLAIMQGHGRNLAFKVLKR